MKALLSGDANTLAQGFVGVPWWPMLYTGVFSTALCLWIEVIETTLPPVLLIASCCIRTLSFLTSPQTLLLSFCERTFTQVLDFLCQLFGFSRARCNANLDDKNPSAFLRMLMSAAQILFILQSRILNFFWLLQVVSLHDVSATEAALVYTIEPLWGAGFAWLLLGERWGPLGWVGAALILGEQHFNFWMGLCSSFIHNSCPSVDALLHVFLIC
jgi:hypothetical protein